MKTLKNLSFFLLTAVFLYSCSKKAKPEDVATAFQTSFLKLDFEKASELGTEKTKEFMKTMKGFAMMMGEEKFKEEKAKAEKAKIEITGCKCEALDDNKQECTVSYKNEEGNEESSPVVLTKVDGKWLVDMSKEDAGMNAKENSENGDMENPDENIPEDGSDIDSSTSDASEMQSDSM